MKDSTLGFCPVGLLEAEHFQGVPASTSILTVFSWPFSVFVLNAVRTCYLYYESNGKGLALLESARRIVGLFISIMIMPVAVELL